jgi:ribose transport system ATP-binding protein
MSDAQQMRQRRARVVAPENSPRLQLVGGQAARAEMLHNRSDVASGALLRLSGISKSFIGVQALSDFDFDLLPGEVHVLFGENGAGKSTLINIIAGALSPDAGSLELQGVRAQFSSVHEARRQGIAAVFQDFSLAPDLTVQENLFLGQEPKRGLLIDRGQIRAKSEQVLSDLGFRVNPRERVSRLSRAEQQMVEIAKAILVRPKVIIFDEPTASLTEQETRQLFQLIARLRNEGAGIIYITHRIAEIFEIGDRVTVMRDGRRIKSLSLSELDQIRLVELMTGRPVGDFFPAVRHRPGEVLLRIEDLKTVDGRVSAASLEVRAGEIVGLAGLVGCGKSEIGRACFGLSQIAPGSTVEFAGARLRRPSPRQMLRRGLHYLPSDRRREGLLLERPVRENIGLAMLSVPALRRLGFLRRGVEKERTRALADRMRVRPLNIEGSAIQFSGGNQQKIVLARSLARDLRLLVLDEPTVGVDVASKAEIYGFLAELVEAGMGILLISSDLPEILNLCRRVYVIRNGSVAAHFTGQDITEASLLRSFFESH